MKTIHTYISALLLSIVLLNAACNKDGKCQGSPDITKKVVGNYRGNGVSLSGVSYYDKEIKISRVSKNKIKLEPVGHTYFNTFELAVTEKDTAIIDRSDENYRFSASASYISFKSINHKQSFRADRLNAK